MRKTITFIGNGNMAIAIAEGLKDRYDIEVVGRDMHKLDDFEQKLGVACDKALLDGFDISDKEIILCIKPNNIEALFELFHGKAATLYSVLAGTSIEKIASNINARSYVRAMPNLAATVQKSMTTLTGDKNSKEKALAIFNSIGQTLWLESEKELDIATAVAGSGPAYLALIAEALADGAVKTGLKRDDATALIRGLFEGFSALLQEEHPALLKERVMSPGGTTAAGYGVLEKNGVRHGCIEAVETAYMRAKELT